MDKSVKGKIRRKAWPLLALVLLLCVAYSFAEARWIRRDESVQYVSGLPAAFDGMKVVFVSDLHFGEYFDQARLTRLVEDINDEDADLILLGGDYAESYEDFITCMQLLSKLRSEHGVFAVLGNHDTYANEETLYRVMRENAVTPCNAESFYIERAGQRLAVAGFPFRWNKQAPFSIANVKMSGSDCVLLLSHDPLDVGAGVEAGVAANIAFAGHTHGGQITLFGMIGLKTRPFPAFTSPWYEEAGVSTLHSNGIGTTGLPVRFFARPMWHAVTLKGVA